MNNLEDQVKSWIKADSLRMAALRAASKLGFEDWCLSAGFVRNLIWDRLHSRELFTPLNDIDFIYFNSANVEAEMDQVYERALKRSIDLPWSVKNQARMHLRNHDQPYRSCVDAMSYWVEVETAVGVNLSEQRMNILAPFGLDALFNLTITLNQKRPKPEVFRNRIQSKQWCHLWPLLKVNPISP